MLLSFIEAFLYLTLPILLLIALLLGYVANKGMFIELGLTGREVGLLIIGPIATMLFDLPLFIYEDYFLALNIGGALIPLVVSLYFIFEKKISLAPLAIGIFMISLITFIVTDVEKSGVVSYFPYYLVPSVAATLLAFVMFSRSSRKTPGYAYAISTLGVLIGADIYHLPEIFQEPFRGSMGGAGLYDLVFVAGLLSFCLCLPFIEWGISKTSYLPLSTHSRINEVIRYAKMALRNNQYQRCLQGSLSAVHLKADEVRREFRIIGSINPFGSMETQIHILGCNIFETRKFSSGICYNPNNIVMLE